MSVTAVPDATDSDRTPNRLPPLPSPSRASLGAPTEVKCSVTLFLPVPHSDCTHLPSGVVMYCRVDVGLRPWESGYDVTMYRVLVNNQKGPGTPSKDLRCHHSCPPTPRDTVETLHPVGKSVDRLLLWVHSQSGVKDRDIPDSVVVVSSDFVCTQSLPASIFTTLADRNQVGR